MFILRSQSVMIGRRILNSAYVSFAPVVISAGHNLLLVYVVDGVGR